MTDPTTTGAIAPGDASAMTFDPAAALGRARGGGVLERAGVTINPGAPRPSGLARHFDLLCNRPLLARVGLAQSFYAVLAAAASGERFAHADAVAGETPAERRQRRADERADRQRQRLAVFGDPIGRVHGGESAVVGGVAVIEARGTFVKDRADHAVSGMVSTEVLGAEFDAAMDDPAVKSILFDIDSGGGTVDGSFELADRVAERRGEKPIAGFANGCACSAAYLLLSAVDRGDAYAYRTADVGSIGVIAMGMGWHRRLDAEGFDPWVIKSGRYKDSGSNKRANDEDDFEYLQGRIDATAAQFFEDVAARRPGLTVERIDAMEARVFSAHDAEDLGLIDGVTRFELLLGDMIQANAPGAAPTNSPL